MSGAIEIGLHFCELPADGWADRVRRYEELGFASITFTDHPGFAPQWDPVAAVATVAAVTERIRVGTLVLNAALRNPVELARAAATVDRASGGRLDLGLGAGYVAADFDAVGVSFSPASDRLGLLEETCELLRQLWSQESTTFEGEHVRVHDAPMAASEAVRPRLLVGGGGPKVLSVAGRHADVVSMIPRQDTGTWDPARSLGDGTLASMETKATWVRQAAAAADRDPEQLVLHTMAYCTAVGDHPGPAIAAAAAEVGVDAAALRDSSFHLVGTADEVVEHLHRWRERTGISYVSLFDPGDEQVAYLAERVLPALAA
ncbi:MAG: TIGR03621 family F420-dependent LLM class oxidoreductase [Acidimicrobiia bacterium]|nr:TIGR03621 family F420-dependent LLM class oxidoreductase [Acidimicrobiia bacterium]